MACQLLSLSSLYVVLRVGVVLGAAVKQRFNMEIPRVTVEDLAKNATLRTGLYAYVLTGHVRSQWKASNWTLDYLHKKIPFEWVDFYDQNMKDVGNKPFLFKYAEALPHFNQKIGIPRYMQLRLSLRGWKRLRKDLVPLPDPSVFWSDEEWIFKCMRKDGRPDDKAMDNFYTTVQWKFLLIGEKGTQMFFHQDGTASSSWQAQLVGKKRWTICPNTETRYLSTSIDTFNEKDLTNRNFARAHCGQVLVEAGDLLYYPGLWWHQTHQLETPSIAYTGALVGTEADRSDLAGFRNSHSSFLQEMYARCRKCWHQGDPERKCEDISLKWPGAAPPVLRVLCDEYFKTCFELWEEHSKTLFLGSSKRPGRDDL